eukprot:284814949_2
MSREFSMRTSNEWPNVIRSDESRSGSKKSVSGDILNSSHDTWRRLNSTPVQSRACWISNSIVYRMRGKHHLCLFQTEILGDTSVDQFNERCQIFTPSTSLSGLIL